MHAIRSATVPEARWGVAGVSLSIFFHNPTIPGGPEARGILQSTIHRPLEAPRLEEDPPEGSRKAPRRLQEWFIGTDPGICQNYSQTRFSKFQMTPFFPKVTPHGSPKGTQNPPKWSPKACPGESQNASPILTHFFNMFHYFSNMAMCCKRNKYHIETTFFICTHGPRKSKKNTPKTPQSHSKNHSKISPKPNPNRDPEKALQKVLQFAQKYQHLTKMGSRKRVQTPLFFIIFEHWGTSGHPHGPQSFQKRSKEASKRQFGIIFAPIFTHFRPRAFLSSGQQANNLDTHTHPHGPKAPKEVQS